MQGIDSEGVLEESDESESESDKIPDKNLLVGGRVVWRLFGRCLRFVSCLGTGSPTNGIAGAKYCARLA